MGKTTKAHCHKQLLELIDACRERGVLNLHLPDGTAFTLDPTFTPRRPLQSATTQGTITADPAPSEQPRDAVLDEIDAELFGSPLSTAESPK